MPAVEKVFSILEVLARSNTGMTLRELAEVSQLPKSSVHGILVTLQRCGYLYRSQRTSRYLFGRKLLMLANGALSGLELRDHAETHMRALARRAHLPVYLGIIEVHEAVVVAKLDYGFKSRSIGCWIGKRLELHCTGLGKALIANWTPDSLEHMVKERSLTRHNDNTIATLSRLTTELASVRSLGYAIDDEEDVLGFRSVGAPIHDAAGNVVAAFGVAGTVGDITADNALAIAAEVKAVSAEFTAALSTHRPHDMTA